MHKLSRKIICLICCLFIITNTMYVEGSGEVYPEETEFCSINDFEDFHYYLFCNTNIGSTSPSIVNAFIGSGAERSDFIKKWRLFDGETEIEQKEADDRY